MQHSHGRRLLQSFAAMRECRQKRFLALEQRCESSHPTSDSLFDSLLSLRRLAS